MRFPQFDHSTPKELRDRVGVACTSVEDKCRQEFKADTDTLTLLKRYGAGVPLRPVAFGEAFTDTDLLSAHQQVQALETAYDALPAHLREKFGSWTGIVSAIQSGELTTLDAPPAPVAGSQE